jgi:hypothetical protein
MKTEAQSERSKGMTGSSSLRPLGNVRYVAPGECEPDPAEWEYRKTSKKGNRVYVRRLVTLETVRKLTLEALSQLKPEIKKIVVKVADRPIVRMNELMTQDTSTLWNASNTDTSRRATFHVTT